MASFFLTRPAATGRPRVRRIRASVSPSSAMFSDPAAPAPTAMHRMAMAATSGFIDPGAMTSPVAAVKTTTDMTRGFSSWKKSSGWAVESAGRVWTSWVMGSGVMGEGRIAYPKAEGRPFRGKSGPPFGMSARDQCSSPLTTGSSLNWWVGGGEDRVHSRVVAPSPHGLATPGRRRMAASASMTRKTSTPTAVIA